MLGRQLHKRRLMPAPRPFILDPIPDAPTPTDGGPQEYDLNGRRVLPEPEEELQGQGIDIEALLGISASALLAPPRSEGEGHRSVTFADGGEGEEGERALEEEVQPPCLRKTAMHPGSGSAVCQRSHMRCHHTMGLSSSDVALGAMRAMQCHAVPSGSRASTQLT